jgi:hypothetical protein
MLQYQILYGEGFHLILCVFYPEKSGQVVSYCVYCGKKNNLPI